MVGYVWSPLHNSALLPLREGDEMTGGQVDLFREYVRRRLEAWGDVFALHKDCEYLGHQSKNLLQVLIDHRGEMPGRAVGFKPLEVPLLELEVEQVVSEISKDNGRAACSLRAHFCGRGRRKVERYQLACDLVKMVEGPSCKPPSLRQHFYLIDDGVDRVSRLIARG
jgi:hypothetical protein